MKERNLLCSRKKHVLNRIDDITKMMVITPVLETELKELVVEYKILQETINHLPIEKKEKKRLLYPHEFYKAKKELFFSND